MWGDLGCRDETDRFAVGAEAFGVERLAGLAPGNQDTSFLVNLFWHPKLGFA